MNWILGRLSETSTWRGLILILTAAGITMSPELVNAITAAGLALVGLINVIRKEPRVVETLPWLEGQQQKKG